MCIRDRISPAAAERVFDRLDTLPVIYDCFLDGWGYMDAGNYARIDQFISDPRVNRMVKELRKPVEDFRAFIRRENRPLQKIQMFFRDMDCRREALESLPREFPDMAVTSSITNNIEINDKTATKGAVSYTHLDVYKRQAIPCLPAPAAAGICPAAAATTFWLPWHDWAGWRGTTKSVPATAGHPPWSVSGRPTAI